jgi:hypothetical protein
MYAVRKTNAGLAGYVRFSANSFLLELLTVLFIFTKADMLETASVV